MLSEQGTSDFVRDHFIAGFMPDGPERDQFLKNLKSKEYEQIEDDPILKTAKILADVKADIRSLRNHIQTLEDHWIESKI